jgi:hypothetical protein
MVPLGTADAASVLVGQAVSGDPPARGASASALPAANASLTASFLTSAVRSRTTPTMAPCSRLPWR